VTEASNDHHNQSVAFDRSLAAAQRGAPKGRKSMTTNETAWGVGLSGDDFDLEDWFDTLKEPFDPWVLHEGDNYILRTFEFQSCKSAEEVLNNAIPLIDVLNGAMRVTKRSHPVSYRGVYQLFRDGWRQPHIFPPRAATNLRAKVHAGTQTPSPPRRNNVQVWVELSDTSDHLSDALVYIGRGGWFDIYKAIECLEDWAGSQSDLENKQWVDANEFRLMKRTANSQRHRAGGKWSPPSNPMSQDRSMELLAKLIECSFEEAQARFK
jgi:hypothetical protein